jgi:hypothetical protein
MDSEPKSGRSEEATLSLLGAIRERLKPILLGRWRAARKQVSDRVARDGLTAREQRLFFGGFQEGYWRGARDVTTISPSDLCPRDRSGQVH